MLRAFFLLGNLCIIRCHVLHLHYTPSCAHKFNSVNQFTDDPLWWKDDEVKLLAGTRLDIAVKEHIKLVGRLTGWRNRLVELQRYSHAGSKDVNPKTPACLRKLAVTLHLLWHHPCCSQSVACELVT